MLYANDVVGTRPSAKRDCCYFKCRPSSQECLFSDLEHAAGRRTSFSVVDFSANYPTNASRCCANTALVVWCLVFLSHSRPSSISPYSLIALFLLQTGHKRDMRRMYEQHLIKRDSHSRNTIDDDPCRLRINIRIYTTDNIV